MGKSLSHSAQTLAALHYRFWCHTSPILFMEEKIILKLGFNHFKIKFLLGNIINPCRTGWLFRMSSSYTFLFAETDHHVRFVRFPKFQPLTPTSSYNTLHTKIQNFTLIITMLVGRYFALIIAQPTLTNLTLRLTFWLRSPLLPWAVLGGDPG